MSASDFADSDLADAFQIVIDLREAGRAIESHAVLVEASRRGCVSKLSAAYIGRLVNAGYAPANAEYYSSTVARLARNRRLMAAARTLLAREYDASVESSELLNRFEAATSGLLNERDGGFVTFVDAVIETVAEHRDAIATGGSIGFGTGFPSLDSIIGGSIPAIDFVGWANVCRQDGFGTFIRVVLFDARPTNLVYQLGNDAEGVGRTHTRR